MVKRGEKEMRTSTKATVAGGSATTITGYLALIAEVKWGIPLEYSIPLIGLVGALAARWAGRLLPDVMPTGERLR